MNNENTVNGNGLQPIVSKLEQKHYPAINSLCDTIVKQANRVRELEVNQSASQYVTSCIKVAAEIQLYIKTRVEHLVPYLYSLSEKYNTGHDCSGCSGGACSLQHEMQYVEMKQAHDHLKDILSSLSVVSLPLYSETIYPGVYRVLRNYMAITESNLTELFSYEESQLIPGVAEAQQHINVRS